MGTILGNNTTIGGGGGGGGADPSASLKKTLLKQKTVTIDPDLDAPLVQLDESSMAWMHWVVTVNGVILRASHDGYFGNIDVDGAAVTIDVQPYQSEISWDSVYVHYYSESEIPTFDITISIEIDLETVAPKQTVPNGGNVALCIPIAGDDMYYMSAWECRVGNVGLFYDGGCTLYGWDEETGNNIYLEAVEETYQDSFIPVYALQLSVTDSNSDPVPGDYEVEILHQINMSSNPGVLYMYLVGDNNGHGVLDRCYEEIRDFYALGYSIFAVWDSYYIYTGVISEIRSADHEGAPWSTARVSFGEEVVEYKTANETFEIGAYYMPLIGEYPGRGGGLSIGVLYDADAGVYTLDCTAQEIYNFGQDLSAIPPLVYYGTSESWVSKILGIHEVTTDDWNTETATFITTMGEFTASSSDDYPSMPANNNNNNNPSF